MAAGLPKMRHGREYLLLFFMLPALGFGGLAQQSITISVPQSLFLDCSTSLTLTLIQPIPQGALKVGSWSCNVDALTRYRLNSILVPLVPNSLHVGDFAAICVSATGGGSPRCATSTALSGSDPDTRRGIGGNTAGTKGADFFGEIVLNVSEQNAAALPASYIGVIIYSVTDLTP